MEAPASQWGCTRVRDTANSASSAAPRCLGHGPSAQEARASKRRLAQARALHDALDRQIPLIGPTDIANVAQSLLLRC